MIRVAFVLCLRFFVASAAGEHDHGHDHGGDDAYEWAGIFDTPQDTYKWYAQKVGGKYADPTMKMVILKVDGTRNYAALKAEKTEAAHGFEETCIEVKNGADITPKAHACYVLHFDDTQSETVFNVKTTGVAGVAIFTAHFPTEFEDDKHYFKDTAGGDVEPVAKIAGNAFEWAGIFDTPEDVYMWSAQKTGEGEDINYADPAMDIMMVPVAANGDHEKLESLVENVNEVFRSAQDTPCITVNHAEDIVPHATKCYKLVFEETLWQSLYPVKAMGTAGVAVFAQHFPTEFENTAHYLKDDHGHDIEPLDEIPEKAGEKAPWVAPTWKLMGEAIGATLLVNLVTLTGVVLAVPAFAKAMIANEAAFASILGGFCGGAIIACAFFLLLLESSHFFNEWTDEVDIVWRWGTSVIAGFFFPTVIQILTGCIFSGAGHSQGTAEQQDVEAENKEVEDPSERARLFAAVIIGDAFHNLCDGFFIGAAFKACGPSFGWTASLSSILHEIPQELADYSLLTGSLGRLPAWKALVFNFLSGLSVMIGAIIVTEVDVGNTGIGVILAFGGGVYLHVAAVECVPRMYAKGLSNQVRLLSMAMFVLGTIIIGLVLLKHEHCSPPTDPGADPAEAAADPHAGHNH